MSLNNKTFKDNKTGEIIKVIDSFENIAILENKTKIDVRRLMDPNLFTEQVDPNIFFNTQNAYNDLFEKIKTIPTQNIPDDNGEIKPVVNIDSRYTPPVEDDSAIIYGSIDDEKAELAKKYGVNLDNKQSVNKQNEAFAKILGDSEEVNELPTPVTNNISNDEKIQTIIVNREEDNVKTYTEPKEDPIYTMFRGVKRSVDFNIDLKLENKIPRLDFIEMMEDSYNKSIIDFLAEEFMNELLKDPKSLKERIKAKITEMVYNKPKKTVTRKTTTRKTTTKKSTAKPTPTEKTVTRSKRTTRRDLSDTKDLTDLSNIIKKETETHD